MRSLRMTVSGWMAALVTGLLLAAAAQPAKGQGLTTTFYEDFNGLIGSTGNGDHTVAQAGHFIGLDTDWTSPPQPGTGNVHGWRAHRGTPMIHYHIAHNPYRWGLNTSNGLGNNYDGCPPPGCGAAHETNVGGNNYVQASVLVRLGFYDTYGGGNSLTSSGEAFIFLGDSTLTAAVGGPVNAYRVDINDGFNTITANGDFATLIDGVPASSVYTAPAVSEWYMIRITVSDVGTTAEMAILEIADANDTTGEPGAFTLMGTFTSSGGAFDLTHIALVSINDQGNGGGRTAKMFDNIQVAAAYIPPPGALVIIQ